MKVGDLIEYKSGEVRQIGVLLQVAGMNALWLDLEGKKHWTHTWNLKVVNESR